MPTDTSAILRIILHWAKAQDAIRGLALVGSHARNEARTDSDIDLVLLADNPGKFRNKMSLAGIDWSEAGVHATRYTDEAYGVAWSRRLWLETQREIEFTFVPLSWAAVSPVDEGTKQVVTDGFVVLLDPDGLLGQLVTAVARMR
jgi:predicted nucleotidyltransferase